MGITGGSGVGVDDREGEEGSPASGDEPTAWVLTELDRDRGLERDRKEFARDLGCKLLLLGEAGGIRTALDTGTDVS